MRERSRRKARVRALSTRGHRLRRHPHPNPLPQAGEGAHLPRGFQRQSGLAGGRCGAMSPDCRMRLIFAGRARQGVIRI
ncbi:hypothetical protein EAS61_19935 [Bradyrhizobium zhanjiangense]|uniref:Uncharacterized protein n=1 Tax=Bradyrhizobium zhanjiangense TaxID=1325107 RepID=A0A4Q0QKF3_9BRAD|nr:hypothetical protein EAS61_19935 [Bradyrhizobium zhanjiangense]